MLRKRTLQSRLIVTGFLMTMIPLIIVFTIVYRQNTGMNRAAVQEVTKMTYVELDRITESVHSLAESQHKTQKIMEKNMKCYLR